MEDFVGVSEIIAPLADSLIDAHPAAWQKERASNDVRREAAIAFAVLHLYELARGIVETEGLETLNGKPAPGDVPCDAPWGVSHEAAERMRRSLNLDDLPGDLWNRINQKADEREARESQHQAQEEAKRTAHRYTLEEAWTGLARMTGWQPKRWKDALLEDVRAGRLPLRNPSDYSDRLPYAVPDHIGAGTDQVDADGLNQWLDSHSEWQVEYRFGQSSLQPETRPRQVSEQQDDQILTAIRALGHNPSALPVSRGTQPGVKAAVWERLGSAQQGWTRSKFDHAWKRLRAATKIAEAP